MNGIGWPSIVLTVFYAALLVAMIAASEWTAAVAVLGIGIAALCLVGGDDE